MFPLYKRFKSKAFTLVEMLVVIAIIIIVIGAGVSMLSNRQSYEYKTEVEKIYKIITDAQANATKSSPIITLDSGSTLNNNFRFSIPTGIPNVPNRNYIASLRINKILGNSIFGTAQDSLNLEYFEIINRMLLIDDNSPTGNIQNALTFNANNPFTIPPFYNGQVVFQDNIGNVIHPISYMVLIRTNLNNTNRFLPIIFRSDGSLAAAVNQELYVRIRHSSNNRRFRTYFIGITGKYVRKYVR